MIAAGGIMAAHELPLSPSVFLLRDNVPLRLPTFHFRLNDARYVQPKNSDCTRTISSIKSRQMACD